MGGDTNGIRNALRQNAFVGITAKLTYKAKDGTMQHLEADFTRYSGFYEAATRWSLG